MWFFSVWSPLLYIMPGRLIHYFVQLCVAIVWIQLFNVTEFVYPFRQQSMLFPVWGYYETVSLWPSLYVSHGPSLYVYLFGIYIEVEFQGHRSAYIQFYWNLPNSFQSGFTNLHTRAVGDISSCSVFSLVLLYVIFSMLYFHNTWMCP